MNCLNARTRQKLLEEKSACGPNLKKFLGTGWTPREQAAEGFPPCRSDSKPKQSPTKWISKILVVDHRGVSNLIRRNNLSVRARTTLCQQLPPDYEEKSFKVPKVHSSKDRGEFYRTRRGHKYGWSTTRVWSASHADCEQSFMMVKTTHHEQTHFTCVLRYTA